MRNSVKSERPAVKWSATSSFPLPLQYRVCREIRRRAPPRVRTKSFKPSEKLPDFASISVSPTTPLSISDTVKPAAKKRSVRTPNSLTDLKLMGSSKQEVDPQEEEENHQAVENNHQPCVVFEPLVVQCVEDKGRKQPEAHREY